MDITCAHCGEPWEVYGLRHEGWGYPDNSEALRPLGEAIVAAHERLTDGSTEPEGSPEARKVNTAIHNAVLSGKGCPSSDCGFAHKGEGQHREQQMREIVFDGVTDEDPMLFL